MKTLKQFKNKNLYKIHIPTSIESWDEYIIATDEKEAKLAQQLLGLEEHKLEFVATTQMNLDKIWYFVWKNNNDYDETN
jgi:hypothetical protein